jgi:nucleoid-associated protein YgaU
MSDGRGRLFGGIAALAVLWIVVYWWWEPRSATISFDPGPAGADAGTAAAPPHASRAPVVEPRGPEARPAEEPRASVDQVSRPQPEIVPPERPTTVPAVIAPEFRDYVIRDGDTLETIARRELGSARHVDAIIAANPLMSPTNLKIGRTIRIPLDPGNIQGKPNPDLPQPPPSTPVTAEYTVKQGDTLQRIAREYYGSVTYDELIYQANRDQLSSKDDLRIGQKLKMPPKEDR